MTLTRGKQHAIIAVFFAVLAVFYAYAWLSPAIGLYHDDAVYLVTAKAIAAGHGYTIESLPHPIPQTKYPPLFPAVLALFVLVSQQPQWLKLLPLLCGVGWLFVTRKLLLKMGASRAGAMLLVGLTAASPEVIFLSTSLMSETLFALLITATLLMLLEDQPLAAGILAGLATLTRTAGAPLIVACILTLVFRRRLRGAAVFTAASALIVAPWLGWSLARAPNDLYYGRENYVALNILVSFAANEKVIVLTKNVIYMLGSIPTLLIGFSNLYVLSGVFLIGTWCLFVRRQLVPDLFVGLYCGMLLCWAWPPLRFVVPVLPLLLWMGWRVLNRIPSREPLAACVAIVAMLGLWANVRQIQSSSARPANWTEMASFFQFIQTNTKPDAILMANIDPLFYLYTDRKAVRGFVSNGYGLFYAPKQEGVTPDELSKSILRSQVSYVVITPDQGSHVFAEAPSFQRSVEALEHGGILEPVPLPGIDPHYRLLHVAQSSF